MDQPAPTNTPTNYREIFALSLRILGAFELLLGLMHVGTMINVMSEHYKPQSTGPGAYALHAVVSFIAGLYLLRGAPLLVSFAYQVKGRSLSDLPLE